MSPLAPPSRPHSPPTVSFLRGGPPSHLDSPRSIDGVSIEVSVGPSWGSSYTLMVSRDALCTQPVSNVVSIPASGQSSVTLTTTRAYPDAQVCYSYGDCTLPGSEIPSAIANSNMLDMKYCFVAETIYARVLPPVKAQLTRVAVFAAAGYCSRTLSLPLTIGVDRTQYQNTRTDGNDGKAPCRKSRRDRGRCLPHRRTRARQARRTLAPRRRRPPPQ